MYPQRADPTELLNANKKTLITIIVLLM